MKKYIVIFSFLVFSGTHCFAQQDSLNKALENSASIVDSLSTLRELAKFSYNQGSLKEAIRLSWIAVSTSSNASDQEEYVRSTQQLAWFYKVVPNFDSAFFYVRMSMEVGERLEPGKALADAYTTMGSIYNNLSKFDSAIIYHEKSLDVKRKLKDSLGLAISYNNMGIVYDSKGDYKTSVEFYTMSKELHEALGNDQSVADVLNNIGAVNSSMGELEVAIENLIEAIRIYEQIGVSGSPLTASYGNLGVIYVDLQEYAKAIDQFQKMIEIQNIHGNKYHISFALNGLATIYENLENYDSALVYHHRAMQLAKEFNEPRSIADIHIALGVTYLELNQLNLAEENFLKSLKIREEIGDSRGIVRSLKRLGELSRQRGQTRKAIAYFERSLEGAEELGSNRELSYSYYELYESYKGLNDYQKALENFELHKQFSDSVLNEVKLQNIADLEIQYETEKKEQQIELQEAKIVQVELENERNKILVIVLVAGIVILLLLAYLIIRRKKYQEEIRLESQKAIWKSEQIKAVIQSQESERKRFAMDLHDGFGQLISALRLSINSISNQAKKDLAKSNDLLDDMYRSLKTIAFDLMPHTLMEKGLSSAVDELASTLDSLGNMRVSCTIFEVDDKTLDDRKVDIYRVIQEIVNNTIKYSEASEVTIGLTGEDTQLQIMIEDNGTGFDPDALKKGKGNGWRNISSRLEMMLGTIEFDSQAGRRNSTVIIEIPYYYDVKQVA